MTPRERRVPGIIDGSRRRRIARGAGVQVQDVNRLMKQFLDMQRMMKSMKGGKLRQLLGALERRRPPARQHEPVAGTGTCPAAAGGGASGKNHAFCSGSAGPGRSPDPAL